MKKTNVALLLNIIYLLKWGFTVNGLTIHDVEERLKSLEDSVVSSPCGDWTPYKDEKCIKIFDNLPLQTYADAMKTCDRYSKGSTLLSIHSKDKMEFLNEFLFKTNKIVDNVWIGATRKKTNAKVFEWSDRLTFDYGNWNDGRPTNSNNRMCVQIESDLLSSDNSQIRKWTDTVCNKKNMVVCERVQKWSYDMSNSIIFDKFDKRLKLIETQLVQYYGVSPCDDWTQYRDEKCIKIFDNLPLQTYDDSMKTCDANDGSTLLSIHSDDEMKFLTEFIFKTNKIVNNVWIGAKRNDKNPNVFEWNDGSEFSYTNWDNGLLTNKTLLNCVQLHTELTFFYKSEIGKWTDAECNRKNVVVCEKTQKWSFERLQNKFFETQKIITDSYHNTNKEIKNLQNNLIPLEFIYVQLSGQSEPKLLWPMVEWEDVSRYYAGLFFRVNGGESSQFGTVQEQDSPRLTNVSAFLGYDIASPGTMTIEGNGKMSKHIYTGSDIGSNYSLAFTVSNSEVRPRNMPIKIWKRIK